MHIQTFDRDPTTKSSLSKIKCHLSVLVRNFNKSHFNCKLLVEHCHSPESVCRLPESVCGSPESVCRSKVFYYAGNIHYETTAF